jgi:hypothetical protein
VRNGGHCGHVIDRLTEIYSENIGEILRGIERVKLNLQGVQEVVPKEIEKQVECVKKVKDRLEKRINTIHETLTSGLQKEFIEKVNELQGEKSAFNTEMSEVMCNITDIENLLLVTPKAGLIMQSPAIIAACRQIHALDAADFVTCERHPDVLTGPFIPEYYYSVFMLADFNKMRDMKKTVYSDYLIDDLENVWLLQVDPQGDINNPQYVSAYVELVDGNYDRLN